MVFLNKHPGVRTRIAAPPNKTIVYSGGVDSVQGVFRAWKMLADAKAQDPRRFDYVTLEERLRTLHVTEFGETLFEHANRVSKELEHTRAGDQPLYPAAEMTNARSANPAYRLVLGEARVAGVVLRQLIGTTCPGHALVVKAMQLRLPVDRSRQRGARHVHLAGTQRGAEEQRRAAIGAEAALALLGRGIPAQQPLSGRNGKAIERSAYPGDERCAMRLAAIAAMAMGAEQCWRPD
jgi:hypothetical protein